LRYDVEARSYRQPRAPSDRQKEQKVCIIESTVLPINETVRVNRQLPKHIKANCNVKRHSVVKRTDDDVFGRPLQVTVRSMLWDQCLSDCL